MAVLGVSNMTIVELLERSGATDYNLDILKARLSQRKYSAVDNLTCYLDKQQIASALARAKGAYNADAFAQFQDRPFEQRKVAWGFPGKCFADLAREAVRSTTELFREVVCVKHAKDYKNCIHACNDCQDHFYGTNIEIDHFDVGFYEILVAFLDSHVEGWCILTDDYFGFNYWQRVQNESKRRWVEEGLADKFVAFHNSVAKLQPLCLTCHDKKTNTESSYSAEKKHVRNVCPVQDKELGKSKRRKLDDAKVEEEVKEMEALMDQELVTKLVTGLREAVASMQRDAVVDALAKVPPKLRRVLPMVKTATALLSDLDVYESGEVVAYIMPVLRSAEMPYGGSREAIFRWNKQ